MVYLILFQICLLMLIALHSVILVFLFINISSIFYILCLLILISEVCINVMRLMLFLLVFTHGVMFPCVFCFVYIFEYNCIFLRNLFIGIIWGQGWRWIPPERICFSWTPPRALLSKGPFTFHSQFEVLWTIQAIKIWASNPDDDLVCRCNC